MKNPEKFEKIGKLQNVKKFDKVKILLDFFRCQIPKRTSQLMRDKGTGQPLSSVDEVLSDYIHVSPRHSS